MYSINDILAELQSGVSPETIAEKFTTTLNEAITQAKAAEEAKRQKEIEAELKTAKIGDMACIIASVFDYLDEYFPSHGIDDPTPEDIEKIVDVLDENLMDTIGLVKELENIKDLLAQKPEVEQEETCAQHACKCVKPRFTVHSIDMNEIDGIVDSFLKSNGLR